MTGAGLGPSTVERIDTAVARYFREAFRVARAAATRDAEGWANVVVVLEQFAAHVAPENRRLADAKTAIAVVADDSCLAERIPSTWRTLHTPFRELFELVRRGRNSAVHGGAAARRLTVHAIELSLVLEHAMATQSELICDYMVREPLRALPWQPVSFVRHEMLTNAFSHLPVYLQVGGELRWWWISDGALARYLRGDGRVGEEQRLRATVEAAVASGANRLRLLPARCVDARTSIRSAFPDDSDLPVLITDGHAEELVGIVTPFDLL
jgi:hypothetical protein